MKFVLIAAEALRAKGWDRPDERLAYGSLLGWKLLGLTGDSVWHPGRVLVEGGFRDVLK